MSSSLHPPHASLVWDIRGMQRDTWRAEIQEYKTIFMECDRTVVWFSLFKKEAEAPAAARSAAGPWPQDGQKGQQLLGGPTAIQDKPVIPHQSLPLSGKTHPCPSPATSPEKTLHQLFLFTNRDPKLNPQHCMHLHSTPACLPLHPDSRAEQRKRRRLHGDPWLFLVLG